MRSSPMPRHLILALGLLASIPASGTTARAFAAEEKAATTHGPSTEHGATAEHRAEAQPNILEPQPSLAIWTVAVFVRPLLIPGRFASRPLLAALHPPAAHLHP